MTGQGDDAPPRDDELFRRQDALQQEAREVLAATGLLDLLDRLGKPFVIGSYAHGLMVWRDLDIVILAPGLRGDRLFTTMAPLCAHPWLRRLHYDNETGAYAQGELGDQRHYVVLNLGPDDCIWKIDLSFWTEDGQRSELEHPAHLNAMLTDETRLAILRLKDRWHRRPEYPYTVGGSDIYDAVLEHGVRSEAEFARYLAERGLPSGD